MQISAIKNNFISNYPKQSYEKQGMTSPVNRTELPAFADAKSFVNINFKGGSEIMEAVRYGNIDTLKYELENGTDINFRDGDKDTPLTYSALKNRPEFVEELLKYPNLDINAQNCEGRTALFIASWDNHPEIVKKLLEHPDIDINLTSKKGNSPLTVAAYNGYVKPIEILLQHPDIDVNQKDGDGDTALTNAVRKGSAEVTKLLLEHPDTDVNVQGQNGRTALNSAIREGKIDAVKEILKHPDVDLSIKDDSGRTVMDLVNDTSYDRDKYKELIENYERGVDQRENVLTVAKNIPVDIENLSPDKNIWTEDKISDKFFYLVNSKKLEDASKMIEATPLINLEANDKKILKTVCKTGDPDFVRKVFNYQDNQADMRADYEEKRKDFLENKIQKLSYEELKENPVALHTEDGFRVLMTKEEFNPNDTVDKTSLFELACGMDEDGDLVQDILGKYDNVETKRAKRYAHKDLREIISTYETDGKYQLKFEHIKRNIANPEKKEKAVQQLREFINSEEYTPDMTDTLGNSALHIVATMPDDSARGLIQKLIDKDIDINSQNVTKQTALVSAIKAMRIAQNDEDKTKLLSNIKFLLDKGIDVNVPDSNGQTAFHHACSTTSPALLTMILAKEPNIFKKDNLGHKGNFYLSTPQMKEVYSNYVNN